MAVAGEECSVRFSLKKSSSLAPLTSSTNLTCTSTEQAEVGEFYFETLRHILAKVIERGAKEPKIQHICLQVSGGGLARLRERKFAEWSYGMNIASRDKTTEGFVKNCIDLGGTTLILCELFQNEPAPNDGMIEVVDQRGDEVGVVFGYMGVNILLPYRALFQNEYSTEGVRVDREIEPVLRNTCYIYNNYSYCAGIRLSSTQVLTVKHILKEQETKEGHQLKLAMYPYKHWVTGSVSLVHPQLDAIEITVDDDFHGDNPTFNLF